ncbi:MAG: hypothetical protein AAF363_15755 [Bacteroidota bacterium]
MSHSNFHIASINGKNELLAFPGNQLGKAIGTITADSEPVYDKNIIPGALGINPFVNEGVWEEEDWIDYARVLQRRYGRKEGNRKWSIKWAAQPSWADPFNFYKYNSEFKQQMADLGIDVGNVLSKIFDAGEAVVENAAEATENISKGVGNFSKLLPLGVSILVIGVGILAYQNRKELFNLVPSVAATKALKR